MVLFPLVIPLVCLICFLAAAVRLASRGHALCGALIGLGALGFSGASLLQATGTWLRYVELPPFFQTTTIVGPGDRTFTATIPLARIQRYDSNGRFEDGWFVDSVGGIFAIGLTEDGRIAVAAARTKRVEFFNPDGSSAGPPATVHLVRRIDEWRAAALQLSGGRCVICGPDPSGTSGGALDNSCAVSALESVRRLASRGIGHVGRWVQRHQNKPADSPLS